MSKEVALDLRRYNTPEKLGSLVFDTASLAIEASSNPDMPRINPHFFVKTPEGKVIAPGKDKRDVEEMFVEGDDATEAAKEIRNMFLEENSVYVWISPANPWPETRIEIGGVKQKTKNGKFEYIKAYGISTQLLEQDSLLLGQLLVSISQADLPFPESSEELRRIFIKLNVPEDKSPIQFLSELIDLPEKDTFEKILDGTADKNKFKAVKVAIIAVKPVILNPNVIYSNPFEYGAYIENRMSLEGFGMDTARFGCGSSNIDMITSPTYASTLTEIPIYSSSEGWHDGTCIVCGTSTWVGPCSICKPCEPKS